MYIEERIIPITSMPRLRRIMLRSHCRSDQLDRPDRPHFPTKLDQLFDRACTRLVSDPYSTMHDPHTTSHDSSTLTSSSVTPVRIPGRATIPLGSNLGQVVYSHCLPSFSAPRNCGTKGSFRSAPKWLW